MVLAAKIIAQAFEKMLKRDIINRPYCLCMNQACYNEDTDALMMVQTVQLLDSADTSTRRIDSDYAFTHLLSFMSNKHTLPLPLQPSYSD
jgi:hypothetical protein